MAPRDRLRLFRQRAGFAPSEVAAVIGISVPAYFDLEGDDDLETSISLQEIKALATFLKIDAASLLFAEEQSEAAISPRELAGSLRTLSESRRVALPRLEEEIGWSLEEFLRNPDVGIRGWNLICLRDVCRAVNCSWAAALNGVESGPNEGATSTDDGAGVDF